MFFCLPRQLCSVHKLLLTSCENFIFSQERSCYDVLEIPEDAALADIKKAYRKYALPTVYSFIFNLHAYLFR